MNLPLHRVIILCSIAVLHCYDVQLVLGAAKALAAAVAYVGYNFIDLMCCVSNVLFVL